MCREVKWNNRLSIEMHLPVKKNWQNATANLVRGPPVKKLFCTSIIQHSINFNYIINTPMH
jgi:hypothetical protein